MNKYDLCCIGHITLDKVITPTSGIDMPGGTSYYLSYALKDFKDINFGLVTAVGTTERHVIDRLQQEHIQVTAIPSPESVCFVNIYGENQDNRTQRVLSKAIPFAPEYLPEIEARVFHLGSLLADDFPLETVKLLAEKGLISIDAQGYLREVRDTHVYPKDWEDKTAIFPYIHFLKVNEMEMKVITGHTDVKEAAVQLNKWGVKEVLITLGSMGSVIYDGEDFHIIPAYLPEQVTDATGCGDTYMAGYLYQRAKGADILTSGKFAAAMATLKIQQSGPFRNTEEDIISCIRTNPQFTLTTDQFSLNALQ